MVRADLRLAAVAPLRYLLLGVAGEVPLRTRTRCLLSRRVRTLRSPLALVAPAAHQWVLLAVTVTRRRSSMLKERHWRRSEAHKVVE